MNEKKVANYVENVWERLMGKTSVAYTLSGNKHKEESSPSVVTSTNQLNNGTAHVMIDQQADGSVVIR